MSPKEILLAILNGMRNIFLGFQGKLILFTSILVISIMAIVGYLMIQREEDRLLTHAEEEGKTLAESMAIPFTIALLYEEVGLVEEAGLMDTFISMLMKRKHPDLLYAFVLDEDGKVIAHNDFKEFGKKYSDEISRKAMESWETVVQHLQYDGMNALDVATPLNISSKRWGTLRIGISLAYIENRIAKIYKRIILLTLGLTAGSTMGIILLARILTKPLKKLSKAMDKVHLGEFYVDLTPKGKDEVASLQRSFLWMLERLRRQEEERKKTQELLMRIEKMASLGTLAAGVAHEINNPLGGILNCLSILSKDRVPKQKRKEYLELMKDGLKRIQMAVRNLLDYSQQQKLELVPTDINSLIDQTLLLTQHLMEKRNIQVKKDYSCLCEPFQVLTDRYLMGQVIMNIVLNAIQAMEEGGLLTISTKSKDGQCLIEISDTGRGIPEEILPKIFDPFFTTKDVNEGTGLGLPVSLAIIKRHGGAITVKSQIGKGTTFTISIPKACP